MTLALKEAYDARNTACRHANALLERALHADYPVGAPDTWRKAGHWQNGEVLRHFHDDCLEVRNTRTGKTLTITVFDIVYHL